jgi:hypothetical protein
VWDDFYSCWESSSDSNGDGKADTVFPLTLPVVSCPGKNVGNCSTLVGAVDVNLLWMVRNAQNNYDWAPYEMSGPGISSWVCPNSITGGAPFADLTASQKEACWHDFIAHYGLVNYAGASISTMKRSDWSKTMYFFPDCTPHDRAGGTGGQNFGVLAKIPVLVD